MKNILHFLVVFFLLAALAACQGGNTPTAALPGPGDLVTAAPATSAPLTAAAPITSIPPTAASTATQTPASATDTPPPPSPTHTLPPAAASLVELVNLVDAHALPGDDWAPALPDMPLYAGGEVWAKEASTALIGLGAELLRVAPNTIFTIDLSDPDTLQLDLSEGQIWLNVEGLEPGKTFEVETPAAVASVRGTRFSVRIASDGSTVVSARAGSVAVSSSAGAVDVTEGQQTDILPGQAPAAPAPLSVDEALRWEMADGPALQISMPLLSTIQVISTTTITGEPSWSHDGSRLAFYDLEPTTDEYSYSTVYNLAAQGYDTAQVPEGVLGAAFNPTQDSVAYIQAAGNYDEVCIAANGSPQCTGLPGIYLQKLHWSPDGQRLLVARAETGGSHSLYVYGPDGSPLVQINRSTKPSEWGAAWSPDSRQVAFIDVDQAGARAIWTVNADGSSPAKLQDVPLSTAPLAWSTDGQFLALASQADGLWLVPLNGAAPVQATGTEGWKCLSASWAPNASGWPLVFTCQAKSARSETTLLLGSAEAAPRPLGSFQWGPAWSADGHSVAWGQVTINNASQIYGSVIHVFQVAPELWP